MKTPEEAALVEAVQEVMLDRAKQQIEALGVEHTPELEAQFVGANMATFDALFAIRDGETWRGMSDPREIARALLHVALGEALKQMGES